MHETNTSTMMNIIRKELLFALLLLFQTIISCSSDTDFKEEILNQSVEGVDDTNQSSDEKPEDSIDPEIDLDDAVTTESLGWLANEDVTEKLKSFLENPENNKLCLSHMYKLSAEGIVLPDNFTLCAEKGGGFSLIDVQNSNSAFLEIGDNSLWYNVTIKDTEPLPDESVVRTNNKISVVINSGTEISIINCSFSANTKTHLRINSSQDLVIRGTHFDYGYYQMLIGANSKNILIEECLHSNSFGDGIKTLRGGVNGVENVTVKNTVYEDNWRDGIDTTGGFRNSLVDGCIFRRNKVSGMDLKNPYQVPEDVGPGTRGNDHILVRNSEFIDMNNSLVLTTLDNSEGHNLITDANHAYHLPNNIHVEDCIIERNEGNGGHVFLIKDAHTISWDGLQLLGGVNVAKTMGLRDYPNQAHHRTRPAISQTNYDIDGVNVTTGNARGSNSDYPFDEIGPR